MNWFTHRFVPQFLRVVVGRLGGAILFDEPCYCYGVPFRTRQGHRGFLT
ncbi:MAG: hypothetical protein A07HR67_01719 [uncultured archaeon A07HR67]|jgi:hypothetical protein|nr:MAG: hypothetical protein A07HR67_01719 [uncultured archaeon A07HR67]